VVTVVVVLGLQFKLFVVCFCCLLPGLTKKLQKQFYFLRAALSSILRFCTTTPPRLIVRKFLRQTISRANILHVRSQTQRLAIGNARGVAINLCPFQRVHRQHPLSNMATSNLDHVFASVVQGTSNAPQPVPTPTPTLTSTPSPGSLAQLAQDMTTAVQSGETKTSSPLIPDTFNLQQDRSPNLYKLRSSISSNLQLHVTTVLSLGSAVLLDTGLDDTALVASLRVLQTQVGQLAPLSLHHLSLASEAYELDHLVVGLSSFLVSRRQRRATGGETTSGNTHTEDTAVETLVIACITGLALARGRLWPREGVEGVFDGVGSGLTWVDFFVWLLWLLWLLLVIVGCCWLLWLLRLLLSWLCCVYQARKAWCCELLWK
jgi:hypothetical protein